MIVEKSFAVGDGVARYEVGKSFNDRLSKVLEMAIKQEAKEFDTKTPYKFSVFFYRGGPLVVCSLLFLSVFCRSVLFRQ